MVYSLTWDERKEKAKDLIGFLAGFDIPLDDARAIFSTGYQDLVHMKEEEYKEAGKSIAAFSQMFDAQQKGIKF